MPANHLLSFLICPFPFHLSLSLFIFLASYMILVTRLVGSILVYLMFIWNCPFVVCVRVCVCVCLRVVTWTKKWAKRNNTLVRWHSHTHHPDLKPRLLSPLCYGYSASNSILYYTDLEGCTTRYTNIFYTYIMKSCDVSFFVPSIRRWCNWTWTN